MTPRGTLPIRRNLGNLNFHQAGVKIDPDRCTAAMVLTLQTEAGEGVVILVVVDRVWRFYGEGVQVFVVPNVDRLIRNTT